MGFFTDFIINRIPSESVKLLGPDTGLNLDVNIRSLFPPNLVCMFVHPVIRSSNSDTQTFDSIKVKLLHQFLVKCIAFCVFVV